MGTEGSAAGWPTAGYGDLVLRAARQEVAGADGHYRVKLLMDCQEPPSGSWYKVGFAEQLSVPAGGSLEIEVCWLPVPDPPPLRWQVAEDVAVTSVQIQRPPGG